MPARVDVVLRPRVLADEHFIRATWLRAFRPSAGRAPSGWYFAAQASLISRLLSESETVIAHYPGDSDQIIGYAVAAPPLLHWCYIKGSFRRLGVARALLDAALPETPRRTTHWTRAAEDAALALGLVRDVEALATRSA